MPAWPLQSTTQPVLYCPAKLFPSLTAMQAHTPQIQGGLLKCSREKQNLVGVMVSSLPKASLCNSQSSLQQLLDSRAGWRRATSAFEQAFQDKKPSSAWLEDEPGKVTAREPNRLWLTPLQWGPHQQLDPLVSSAQVQSLESPGTFSLDPFTGIQGGTAVLSVRKGRMIKAAKQLSKWMIPSSAPAQALSAEPLFRNFTKRKSESYFGCMAEKTSTFPEKLR